MEREVISRRRVVADPVDEDVDYAPAYSTGLLSNIVYYIAGIVEILLVLRFVLLLFGASTASSFVSFVYSVTGPLVAPFYGMFGTTFNSGVSRIELESLFAIVVYALIAYAIAGILRSMRL